MCCKTVIPMPEKKLSVCTNCGSKHPDKMKCPHCDMIFCGDCFQVDLEGDGKTIICPNIDCGEKLLLPVVSQE